MEYSYKQQEEGGAVAGGGEARRRIDVVYFLSRGGRKEHPHLFRVGVSHRHRAGVRLRDVKRWLSELRDKDMPDNFSWSYKRKYRTGYLWQDLKDDDLITPISDNQYVLLGCDVRGTPPPPPCADVTPEKSSSLDGKKQDGEELRVTTADHSRESSPEPPPPSSDQDSPGGGEAARRTVQFKIDLSLDLQQEEEEVVGKAVTEAVVVTRAAAAPPGSRKHPVPVVARAAQRMTRAARVLHSLLTCGAAVADDAALRPVLRQSGAGADWPRTPVCPGIDGCGLRMSRKARSGRGGGGKDKAKKRDGGGDAHAHRPSSLPRCSQCGKEFKPQELHSHMQSCRGLRERMRSGSGGGGDARVSADGGRSSAAARPQHEHRRRSKAERSPVRASTTTTLLLTKALSAYPFVTPADATESHTDIRSELVMHP